MGEYVKYRVLLAKAIKYLVKYDGLTVNELVEKLSVELGKPPSTVRTALSRLLVPLQELGIVQHIPRRKVKITEHGLEKIAALLIAVIKVIK